MLEAMERGKPMQKDDNHLSVNVWIINDRDEFLISQRAFTINITNMWRTTGDSAIEWFRCCYKRNRR